MLQDDVQAALSGIELGRIQSAKRIKHGRTNESWLVRGNAGAFVVRLSNTAEASLQIDRRSEATVLEVVARSGIGPEVIRCDPPRHLLVTRYAGETWSDWDAVQPENIKRIAQLLRLLHSLPPPQGIRQVDLLAVVDGYLETLDQHGIRNVAGSPALRTRAREAAVMLREDSHPRLCHNDVHALNIIDDGALRLIDWEYAGLGERFFDLASICVYHRYDLQQRELLLQSYDQAMQDASWHRLKLSCWLFDYVRELWTAVRELSSESAD